MTAPVRQWPLARRWPYHLGVELIGRPWLPRVEVSGLRARRAGVGNPPCTRALMSNVAYPPGAETAVRRGAARP